MLGWLKKLSWTQTWFSCPGTMLIVVMCGPSCLMCKSGKGSSCPRACPGPSGLHKWKRGSINWVGRKPVPARLLCSSVIVCWRHFLKAPLIYWKWWIRMVGDSKKGLDNLESFTPNRKDCAWTNTTVSTTSAWMLGNTKSLTVLKTSWEANSQIQGRLSSPTILVLTLNSYLVGLCTTTAH